MHRPTDASTARFFLTAGVVCLAVFSAAVKPVCAWGDDTPGGSGGPSVSSDQKGAAKAAKKPEHKPSASAKDANEIGKLVVQLGDDLFAVRESASNQLVEKGIAAKPQLTAALESKDAEVRMRAKRILSEVVEADFQRRLGAFSADVDGKQGLTLPGWAEFTELVGNDRAARDLFVEMEQAEGPLMDAYGEGPKVASEKLRVQLASEPAVIDRNAAVAAIRARRPFPLPQSSTSSLGAILAWMFVAGDPTVPVTDDIVQRVVVLPQNIVFQSAASLKNDRRAEVCRKILARWVGRDVSSVYASTNLALALKYNLKEGLSPAVATLKRGKTREDPTARCLAMLLVGEFGNKEHLAILEPFLDDSIPRFDSGGGNQPIQAQVRDIALAMSVKLAGQDPKQFGFTRWQDVKDLPASPLLTLGFRNQAERDAAFKKWNDWKAGQHSDSSEGENKESGNKSS